MRVALACAMPTLLDATQLYVPTSSPVAMVTVYVDCVASGRTTLLNSHAIPAGGLLLTMQVKVVEEPMGMETLLGPSSISGRSEQGMDTQVNPLCT